MARARWKAWRGSWRRRASIPISARARTWSCSAALDGDGRQRAHRRGPRDVELAPRAEHKVGGYSHGMRQRLGIAAALLRRPRLLILDEPATGLDPAGMRDMRALIRRLAGEGITVLLSSHQLPEVQELCDRVAIVDRGRVVYEGALADLRRQGGAGYGCAPPTTPARWSCAHAQPGIEHAASGEHGLRLPGRGAARWAAVARAGAGGRRHPRAHAGDGDAGGPVLRLTEGEAHAGRPRRRWRGGGAPRRRRAHAALGRRAAPRATLDAHDLALGAAQAALAEAHVPRPRRGRRSPAAVRGAERLVAPSHGDGEHLASRHPDGPRHAAADAVVQGGFLFPLIAALVSGDIIAAEDENGTLKTILTRSVDRGQVFAAKVLAAMAYGAIAVYSVGRRREIAGVASWGFHAVVTFSGTIVAASEGLKLVFFANACYLIPMLSVVTIGVLLSTATRNSAASVVGTVVFYPALHRRSIPGIGGDQALPAHRTVPGLAGPAARPDRLDPDRPLGLGVRAVRGAGAGGGVSRVFA